MWDGLLARNLIALLKRRGVEQHETEHLDADALATVLQVAEGSRCHLALLLIAATELRRGNGPGLAWEDGDLDAGTVRPVRRGSYDSGRTTQRKPMWLMPVSIICGRRAAGR